MAKLEDIKTKINYFKDKLGLYIVAFKSSSSIDLITKDDLSYINIDINKKSFDFVISTRFKENNKFKVISKHKFKIEYSTKKQKEFIINSLCEV